MNETTYLQTELDKMQRKLRIGGIAMLVVLVLMFAYFQWITRLTAEIFEPENIAEVATNELKKNLPGAADTLGTTLVSAAPYMVRFVLQQVMDGVLPAITQTVTEQLQALSGEAANIGSRGVTAAFTATINKCNAALPKPKKGKPDPVAISEQLDKCVQKTMPAELDAAATDILGDKLTASAAMIRQIDAKLKSLASKPNPDREDELGKQLVTTWWTFLEQNHPGIE